MTNINRAAADLVSLTLFVDHFLQNDTGKLYVKTLFRQKLASYCHFKIFWGYCFL